MAGAGARTRKDGSASAKVGSIEVLRSRQIGPAVPMRRQVQAMATGAASAERAARTPAARAAAAELRAKAESAGQARAAFLAARKGSKAAASAAHEAGARAMRAGAAAQFAKAQPKAAEPVKVVVAKAPRKPVELRSIHDMNAVQARHERVSNKIWRAEKAHRESDPHWQTLNEKADKASAHASKNFKSYEKGNDAKVKSEMAYEKLSAHEAKLSREWREAHPKEARLLVAAGAARMNAIHMEHRTMRAVRQRSAKRDAERYKAEAPAREKAAAEAAVKRMAAAEQTAKAVSFLSARAARHGIKFKHEDGTFHVEGKYGAMRQHMAPQDAKKAMRAAVRQKVAEVRNKRENDKRGANVQREMDAGVAKARAAVASAPAAPKGHANIHAVHEHGAAPSVRPVKALAQAGDVVAHRPIGEHRKSGGEGYSITHGPTGLRIMHAGSAAEAKHIVAGLGTPHWSKMLEKTVAHDNEAARLTGEHVKRLAAEHASGGAKAAPTPKLAFGKMTSDNKFKAARAA